jgi:hypothetical protein
MAEPQLPHAYLKPHKLFPHPAPALSRLLIHPGVETSRLCSYPSKICTYICDAFATMWSRTNSYYVGAPGIECRDLLPGDRSWNANFGLVDRADQQHPGLKCLDWEGPLDVPNVKDPKIVPAI